MSSSQPLIPTFTTAKDACLRGETYRVRGNYSHAIDCFSQALRIQPGYAYAHAHRGAAWGAMLQIDDAVADFTAAGEATYPWVTGQRAEAERLCARQLMANTCAPEHGDFWVHLHEAEVAFRKATAITPGSAWVWAHQGATLTHKYVAMSNTEGTPPFVLDAIAADAHHAFLQAIAANTAYSWAMAFNGYLYALEAKWDECEAWIYKAKMFDTEGTIVALRGVAEVYSFRGERENFQKSVSLAWEATRERHDDFAAVYFAAVGLSLDTTIAPEVAQAARELARDILQDVQSRIEVFLGGLNAIEKRTAEAEALLDKLKNYHGSEAVSILKRDHAWDAWHENPKYKAVFQLPAMPPALRGFFLPA